MIRPPEFPKVHQPLAEGSSNEPAACDRSLNVHPNILTALGLLAPSSIPPSDILYFSDDSGTVPEVLETPMSASLLTRRV